MRSLSVALVGGAFLLAGLIQPVRAQSPVTAGIVAITYFDVAPASTGNADTLLRQFAGETRKEDGNAELTVLQELNRPGHFAIVEAWRDKAALDAHGAAMKALGDKLQPFFTSPFSTRPFLPLAVGAPAPGATLAGAIWVLTHIDVFPAGKDEVAGMVKQLVDDSRKDSGIEQFDAIVWDGQHQPHPPDREAWRDRASLEKIAWPMHTRLCRQSWCRLKAGSTISDSLRRAVVRPAGQFYHGDPFRSRPSPPAGLEPLILIVVLVRVATPK